MSEFKTIETQEQFDDMVKDRLARNTKSIEEKYAGYISPDELKSKLADLEDEKTKLATALTAEQEKTKASDEKIATLTEQIGKYEIDSVKTKIANEFGFDLALAKRLNGTNEEEIRRDAEAFAGLVNKQATPPGYNPTPAGNNTESGTKAAEVSLLRNLRGNE